MAKAIRNGLMDQDIKDNEQKIKLMGRVCLFMQMAIFMKDNDSLIKLMVMELILMLMELN